jgi:Tfp pilus assembly PilM family ATPase
MTEALALQLGIEFAQAEDIKKNEASWSDERVKAAIEKSAAEAAYEFNRRLTFLWNASGAEGGIERILVSGGGSRMPYLCEKLQHQTGLACERLDPLRLIDVAKGLDRDEIMKSKAEIAVAVGLAMRTRADRILPP